MTPEDPQDLLHALSLAFTEAHSKSEALYARAALDPTLWPEAAEARKAFNAIQEKWIVAVDDMVCDQIEQRRSKHDQPIPPPPNTRRRPRA